ncbi:MAG: hypothetical protein E6R03_07090 [Hyphomicrobiaceae bacterium]|nr:MAG: hypothetical protein E6R03_07090 [Hyphomicrobiaceae bacterium]
MMYVVGFNGPPRSGKDTMARMLSEHMDSRGVKLPVREVSLSMPLRRIAYSMVGYEGRHLEGPDYEDFKVTHFSAFGKTGRQLMIDIGEKFLRPCYGSKIMAKLLIQDLGDFPGVVLVKDTGFQVEAETLGGFVGANNFFTAQVHRKGCSFDFSNDSREWVTHNQMSIFLNNGTLDDLRTEAGRLYGRLVNQMGWRL